MRISKKFNFFLQIIFLAVPLIILIKSFPTLAPLYRMTGIVFISIVLFFSIICAIFKHKTLLNQLRILSIFCFIIVITVFLIDLISSAICITDAKGVESILREHISLAKIIYFFICFTQPILLPFPEAVTIIAGSAVLGSFDAFILGFCGTIIGILTMFFISRIGGMKIIKRLVNEKQLEQYHRIVQKNEILILAILFIIPILPDEIICVGAGISGVNVRSFVSIAIISKLGTSFSLSYAIKLTEFFSLSVSQITWFTSLTVLFVISITAVVKKYLNK